MKKFSLAALVVVLLAGCGTSNETGAPDSLDHKDDTASVAISQDAAKAVIFGVNALKYSDSTEMSMHDKAAYYLSLLDSLDKYDPPNNSTGYALSWYFEQNLDTWKIDPMVVNVLIPPDLDKDMVECSDRMKLLWYTHLALHGCRTDSIAYPYLVKDNDSSIVSLDRVSKCLDGRGKRYRAHKTHVKEYLLVKQVYVEYLKNGRVGNIDVLLDAAGFRWKYNVQKESVSPAVNL